MTNPRHGRIERFGNLAVGFRQFAGDAGCQIAGGKGIERVAKQRHDLCLIALALTGKLLCVANAQFVEAQGDGNLGIDHHQPNDGFDRLGQFLMALARTRQQ